ncbi:MAG: hypothetical protein KDA32_08680 [Phycisphaerales bacterium]|nr:hypothetical protein [Phycisphaerales bacterium]
MCGIFGIVARRPGAFEAGQLARLLNKLFKLSESRGKEAAGVAVLSDGAIDIYKEPITASAFIRSKPYRELIARTLGDQADRSKPVAVIGHSRLVTNGAQALHQNNQPVVAENAVAVHNGIICNVDSLWQDHPDLARQSEVDTEVFLRLFEQRFARTDQLADSVRETFAELEGTASVGVLLRDRDAVLLATNNGSLYTVGDDDLLLFASERYILEQAMSEPPLRGRVSAAQIRPCGAGAAMLAPLNGEALVDFPLNGPTAPVVPTPGARTPRKINDIRNGAHVARNGAPAIANRSAASRVERLVDEGCARVPEMRRCTRCILPEAMPFIDFDSDGVCNYCRNWRPIETTGADALAEAVAPYRGCNGAAPDCLLALSGGRDSTYSLHYVKTVLGMNPVAYTYDWGMVTDLARRNQARICGRLGVEHILVSADITQKRANIRKNVQAWLRRPELGTVPLFMAGDKQFFYYANRLRNQMNLKLLIFSMNPLERTDFKTGFCGVSGGTKDKFYGLSFGGRMQLAMYYANQYLRNPAYINSSLWDTLHAFWSYYFLPQDYLQFFHYLMWDEATIERTLIDEYDWELAPDTKSTWRIGDGTASFYNYIYYIGAGFTENDTFRSNQIRQGLIERDWAIERAKVDNHPRTESMLWYCDTIGIDAAAAVKRINEMPKRYSPLA